MLGFKNIMAVSHSPNIFELLAILITWWTKIGEEDHNTTMDWEGIAPPPSQPRSHINCNMD